MAKIESVLVITKKQRCEQNPRNGNIVCNGKCRAADVILSLDVCMNCESLSFFFFFFDSEVGKYIPHHPAEYKSQSHAKLCFWIESVRVER